MSRKMIGRLVGLSIVLGAAGVGLAVLHRVSVNPQTDDAEVFANLIGIAPEVNGRIVRINVKDNQFVRQETAQSQQAALEGQIKDLQRSIGAQNSAVLSARASAQSSQARVAGSNAGVAAAQASVNAASAELSRAEADYAYAENNVLRLEPLLMKQFVTVDLVDQARTSRSVKGEAVRQTRARLAVAEAEWASAVAHRNEAGAAYDQSNAQLDQSVKNIPILDPLLAQRQAREAAVKNAAYDLQRCKVYAPFDARVTSLFPKVPTRTRVSRLLLSSTRAPGGSSRIFERPN